MLNNIFGENLKKAREKCNLTQEQLAYELNVSASTIGMYEQGRREPDLDTLIKMSNILHISINMLLGTKERFHTRSIQIDKIIIELIDFIQNQDCVFWKGKELNNEEISKVLYVLKLVLR